jgi:hypothetical protein
MLNIYTVILTIIILFSLNMMWKAFSTHRYLEKKVIEGFTESTSSPDATALQNLASLYSSGEATITPKLKTTSISTSGDIDVSRNLIVTGDITGKNLTVNGNISSTGTVNGVNLSSLNTTYPTLAGNNTFTGTNTFNGTLSGAGIDSFRNSLNSFSSDVTIGTPTTNNNLTVNGNINGKNLTANGTAQFNDNVTIGTGTVNKNLTVNGNISSTGTVNGVNLSSLNTTYPTLSGNNTFTGNNIFKGGNTDNNIINVGDGMTHFPFAVTGKNYIRGDTHIHGKLIFEGKNNDWNYTPLNVANVEGSGPAIKITQNGNYWGEGSTTTNTKGELSPGTGLLEISKTGDYTNGIEKPMPNAFIYKWGNIDKFKIAGDGTVTNNAINTDILKAKVLETDTLKAKVLEGPLVVGNSGSIANKYLVYDAAPTGNNYGRDNLLGWAITNKYIDKNAPIGSYIDVIWYKRGPISTEREFGRIIKTGGDRTNYQFRWMTYPLTDTGDVFNF